MNKISIKYVKKLLFVVNSTFVGGHEVQVKHIVNDYINNGTDVGVLCSDQKVYEYFANTGATLYLLPFNIKGKLWKQIAERKKVAELFLSLAVDYSFVIVSGGSIEAIINPVMAIRMINSQSYIVAYVPMYIDRSLTHCFVGSLYNLILNNIAKIPNEYLTINRIQACIIRKKIGKITNYIPNRIRTVQKPKQSFGPRLLFVGRFDDKQKDITGMIKLLDHQDNPYQHVLLIGDGPDREFILDVANRVRYLKVEIKGWLDSAQIDDLTGTEDILILNSRWEGEPLVVREFLNKGLRCVSKEIVGIRGIVKKNYRFRNQSELLTILRKTYFNNSSN